MIDVVTRHPHTHTHTHSHTNITHSSSDPPIVTSGLVTHAGAWTISAPCSRSYHAIDYPSPITPSLSHNWRLPDGKHLRTLQGPGQMGNHPDAREYEQNNGLGGCEELAARSCVYSGIWCVSGQGSGGCHIWCLPSAARRPNSQLTVNP